MTNQSGQSCRPAHGPSPSGMDRLSIVRTPWLFGHWLSRFSQVSLPWLGVGSLSVGSAQPNPSQTDCPHLAATRLKSLGTFVVALFVCIPVLCFGIAVPPVLAHRPHHVVAQVVLSPDFGQDQTVFVEVRGNVFRSTNGGENWQRLRKGLDNRSDFFPSLVIAPTNKQILYMAAPLDGLYKTEDGGNSWFKINNGLTTIAMHRIAVSPQSADVAIAAASPKGLYATQDGGKTWAAVLPDSTITAIAPISKSESFVIADSKGVLSISQDGGRSWTPGYQFTGAEVSAIAPSPDFANDSIIFVGTANGGIFKSGDKGATFTASNNGLTDKKIRDIVISPTYHLDSTLFLSTWDTGSFRSTDGGKTWMALTQGLTKDIQADQDQFKSPHFDDLAISPSFNSDKTVFLGGFDGLFKTSDAGQIWTPTETLARGTVTALDISPTYGKDSTIAIATYVKGIFISRDKGETWEAINQNNLELPRFQGNFDKPYQDPRRYFDIALSPNFPADRSLFVSLIWTKLLKSTNAGENWDIVAMPKEDRGLNIVLSPNFERDRSLYVISQYGHVFQSTDSGKTFKTLAKVGKGVGNDPTAAVISPNFASDRTLFISGSDGVYKSTDGGKRWDVVANGWEKPDIGGIKLAISPDYATDQTVVAGTAKGVMVTKDGGKTWTKLPGTAYGGNVFIEGVAISPTYARDRTFIVSVQGQGLFKTTDDGQTFRKIGDDSLSFARIGETPSASMPIQFSPAYATDQTLYGFGSAETAVFRSTDGGDTWKVLTVPPSLTASLKGDDADYDFFTSLMLWGMIYRSTVVRVGLAAIAAIISYVLVGFLGLEKRLPLPKGMIKFASAFVVFLAALLILFKR